MLLRPLRPLFAAALLASFSAPSAHAQENTFSLEGYTLGAEVTPEDLEGFECRDSRWQEAQRECRKHKTWKSVTATTAIMLDARARLVFMSKKFETIALTEKSARETIASYSKRFESDARITTQRLGNNLVMMASWGSSELRDFGIQARLATIQGKSMDGEILVDYLDNIQKSAIDALPIYRFGPGESAVWVFFIKPDGQGWASARILRKG